MQNMYTGGAIFWGVIADSYGDLLSSQIDFISLQCFGSIPFIMMKTTVLRWMTRKQFLRFHGIDDIDEAAKAWEWVLKNEEIQKKNDEMTGETIALIEVPDGDED